MLRIIPLGGLGKIGLNMTAVEYGDSIVVIDCGAAFPEDSMHGVDLVLPDMSYLEENRGKVKGFVITHGHEDHIGAIPYMLRKFPGMRIFATRLTAALITNKLEEYGMAMFADLQTVQFGDTVDLWQIQVEFIRTNHSIRDAAALAIRTPAGTIVHTGDFKVDYTPVSGDVIDLPRLAQIGSEGVLALLCDSTNAEKQGHTMSEATVGASFDRVFSDYPMSRVIIATFASNVDRVQQIISAAARHGRKVCLEGRSMVKVFETAAQLGYVDIPDNTLVTLDELDSLPPEETVLVTTGSQGESMAALPRMAASIHRKVRIVPGDVVVFSSHPIPGNEKAVSNVINELSEAGARVIFEDAHVSGHACQEDIKLIYSLVRPRYAVPVHGEARHLKAQAAIAVSLGIRREDVFVLHTGDVLTMGTDGAGITGRVEAGTILVDGLGVGDVGDAVIRDRQKLSESGVVAVSMAFDRYTGRLVAGPDIASRGFVYMKESGDLIDGAAGAAKRAVKKYEKGRIRDWARIRKDVRNAVSNYLWEKTRRQPLIMLSIMEARP